MWYLEYEIADLQEEFAKEMGSFDTENMTVDFIEDMLIKSKPLQIVLLGIRRKQKVKTILFLKIIILKDNASTNNHFNIFLSICRKH